MGFFKQTEAEKKAAHDRWLRKTRGQKVKAFWALYCTIIIGITIGYLSENSTAFQSWVDHYFNPFMEHTFHFLLYGTVDLILLFIVIVIVGFFTAWMRR